MLLAVAPLIGLFLLTGFGFGALLLKQKMEKKNAPKGMTTTPDEGQVVSSEFVKGGNWVVKVYYSKYGYETQIYSSGEYQTRKTGFSTQEQAHAWGIEYALNHGA